MSHILTVLSPLFLIILGAALVQKYNPVKDEWSRVLNAFALQVGLPVLLFTSLAKISLSLQKEAFLIIANSIFVLLSFGAAIILGKILRLPKQMALTLFICFAFGNVAYLGIPVLQQINGEAILPQASLIVAVYIFWIFTLGVGYLNYSTEKNKKNVFTRTLKKGAKNPLLISAFAGLLVSGFSLPLPTIVFEALTMVSASVTPTVLIILGIFIGNSTFGKFSEWIPVLLFSVVTLLILPACFYFGLKLFGLMPAQLSSSIIQAAMPLAITPFALAEKYDLNKPFIARCIVLSTILSVFSLPLWISLLI